MNAIRSHRYARRLSMSLAMLMVLSFAAMAAGPLAAQPANKLVLVFPLSNAADNGPAKLGEQAASALTLAVSDVPGLEAIQFSSTSPSVRRAIAEGRVRQVDVDQADLSLGTSLVIATSMGADYIITGAVQSLVRKDEPVSYEAIVSGQMYDVNANLDQSTREPVSEPKVYRAFGVSGVSTPRAHYTGSEGPLVREALRDASMKAAQTLAGRPADNSGAATPTKKSSSSYKWVLLGALLVGLALAVNNSGDDDGGTSPDAYPPSGVTLEDQDGNVRISWTEPTGSTLTLLRYQIERALDGSGFARIDPGTLGSGTTFYNDYQMISGSHTYVYRIRAVYTQGGASAWAMSGPLRVTN